MCRFVAAVLGRLRALGEDRGAGDSRHDKMTAAAWHGFSAAKVLLHDAAANFAHGFALGLSRDWGSGCGGHWRERVVRGEEALPEAGAERAVVDGAADLEQPIGAAPRPGALA